MQLEELVSKNYKQLNENDIHIWKYIAANRKVCERLSIDELASRCNVSRTTVLRFSKRLGLKGYTELKVYLCISNNTYKKAQSGLETIYQSYHEYMDYLKDKDFTSIIELIKHANNLYIYGTGSIQNDVALEIKRSFLSVDRLFFNIKSMNETDAFVDIMDEKDVIIMISYSGNTPTMIEFARRLKAKNVPIIAITVSKDNDLSHLANESVFVSTPSIVNPMGARYEGMVNYFILIDFIIAKYIDSYDGGNT